MTVPTASGAYGGALTPAPRAGWLWRLVAAGPTLRWLPHHGSPSVWGQAIHSQETGSFTARCLHLRVRAQGFLDGGHP
jgi:hypothetical protein